MHKHFAFLAVFALACAGEGDKESGDTGPTDATCADGRYDGPTSIVDADVTCTGTDVRFYAETEGWTDGGLVFSQETANAEPNYSDEHELASFNADACGFMDELERVIGDGTTVNDPLNDCNINECSVFTCGAHYNDPNVMSYAFYVYDSAANFADCRAIGENPGKLLSDGSANRVNEPSFDLGNCTSGLAAR